MAPNPESPEGALKRYTDSDAEQGHGGHGVPNGTGKEVHYFGAAALVNQNRHSDRLLVLLRLLTFAFAVAAVVVMATNTRTIAGSTEKKAKWYDFDSYRYVLAVNTIIGTYSLAETGLGLWVLRTGSSLMPEYFAVWFDYGHDQGFAYLLFSAASAGAAIAQGLQSGNLRIQGSYTCADVPSFCFLARLSIGFTFAAFVCLAASAVLSGYRVARWFMRFKAPDK